MRTIDALNILNLDVYATTQEIKKAYKKACIKFHPDRNPAGLEMMKVVNAAFEALQDYEAGSAEGSADFEYSELLNDALNVAVNLSGVDVEICGNWVWLQGNTKEHKEALKAAGFKWSKNKVAWYFRPAKYKSFNRGRNWSLDEIRATHGSTSPKVKQNARITA